MAAGAPSPIRENGTSVLYTYRATDPEGADVSWSVSGTDGGDFTITTDSSGRGVLSFEEPPDYDDPADDDRRQRIRTDGSGYRSDRTCRRPGGDGDSNRRQ